MFRHQQNASMNANEDGSAADQNLGSFYAYRNTFDEDSVWLDIPRQSRFILIFLRVSLAEPFSHLHQYFRSLRRDAIARC